MLHEDELKHLQHAIDLAHKALEDGDAPFGAVIMKGSHTLAAARNCTIKEQNPTSHAEMVAIREACRDHSVELVAGSTIFCSCEPCIMCLSAISYAQISKVVFAATLKDAIHFGSGDPLISTTWLNEQANLKVEIVAGNGREAVISLFKRCIEKFGRL